MSENASPGFRVVGETRLRRDGGPGDTPNDVHAMAVEVDEQTVSVTWRGLGGGKQETVRTKSNEVRRHYREVEDARQRTAYRNRKVRCELVEKPRKAKPAPIVPKDDVGRPMVACPECAGGAGISSCGVCEQAGWVTIGQAENWRDEHGGD
jgi:hypothetical protein